MAAGELKAYIRMIQLVLCFFSSRIPSHIRLYTHFSSMANGKPQKYRNNLALTAAAAAAQKFL